MAAAAFLIMGRPVVSDQQVQSLNVVLIPADGAPRVAARLKEKGVLISVLGPNALRAVTHLDVSEADCAEAGRLLADALA